MLVLYIYFHPFHCFLFFLKILFQYYCSGISKDKKTIEIKQNSDNQVMKERRYSLTSKIKVDKIVWWWWKRRQWYWLMMMEKETMQHRIIAFLACKKWSNKYKLMTHELTLQLNVALICASFVYVYLFFDFFIHFFCKKISKVLENNLTSLVFIWPASVWSTALIINLQQYWYIVIRKIKITYLSAQTMRSGVIWAY